MSISKLIESESWSEKDNIALTNRQLSDAGGKGRGQTLSNIETILNIRGDELYKP